MHTDLVVVLQSLQGNVQNVVNCIVFLFYDIK